MQSLSAHDGETTLPWHVCLNNNDHHYFNPSFTHLSHQIHMSHARLIVKAGTNLTSFHLDGMQPRWYLHTEGASPSSFHQTGRSCALILQPNRSQADTYRWACSQGTAVQWLAHQTGLVALAGCSGGLEEESKREGEGGRLKKARQKGERGELLICRGIRKVPDKKEEHHSGGAKVLIKKKKT